MDPLHNQFHPADAAALTPWIRVQEEFYYFLPNREKSDQTLTCLSYPA